MVMKEKKEKKPQLTMTAMKRSWYLVCLLTTASSLLRDINHNTFRPAARGSQLLLYMVMEQRPSSPKGTLFCFMY
jgi:hypothetical protein